MSRTPNARALFSLLLLGLGCAPSAMTTVLQPAPVNIGAARRLAVLQVEGSPDLCPFVVQELINQCFVNVFFTVQDRTGEGLTVTVSGSRAQVSGGAGPALKPDEVGLRIEILGASATQEERVVTRSWVERRVEKDAAGEEKVTSIPHRSAKQGQVLASHVTLGVTLFDASGEALLAGRACEGSAVTPLEGPADAQARTRAVKQAARSAVARLLADITPRRVQVLLPFDEEDPRQQPTLRIALNDLGFAIREQRRFAHEHPESASGHYNLGVMLDAQGHYDEALEEYDAAIRLKPQQRYERTREACARRLEARRAMSR